MTVRLGSRAPGVVSLGSIFHLILNDDLGSDFRSLSFCPPVCWFREWVTHFVNW
jgi:hypothetical protein